MKLLFKKGLWQKVILLPKTLTKKEKLFFFACLVALLGSSFFLAGRLYISLTKKQPSFGGTYREGTIGQPHFLNPIYAYASDVDRDITQLLFAGLMKYNLQGELVPDLAEKYEIKENGRVYEFTLRDAVWEDQRPITADDILFTVKTIQDPSAQSPVRGSWLGVEVQKLSEKRVAFRLQKPYAPFLELTTFKIAPLHLWADVQPQNIALSEKNLQPIASGPYRIKKIKREKSGKISYLELERNPHYFGQKPFLEKVVFVFFDSESALVAAAQSEGIDGFAPQLRKQYMLPHMKTLRFRLPRYFAIFFNSEKSQLLKQKEIREALSLATDRNSIASAAFKGEAESVSSPLMPEIFGFPTIPSPSSVDPTRAKELLDTIGFTLNPEKGVREKRRTQQPSFQFKSDLTLGSKGKEVQELQRCLARDPQVYSEGTVSGFFGEQTKNAVIRFQEKYSKEILVPAGLQKGNGKVGAATRSKLNALCFPKSEESTPLSFTLVTPSEPPLSDVAKLIQKQWNLIGVDVKIHEVPSNELVQNFIKPRNYELLLFGQVLGAIVDPYPFWHSSQKNDPGLNLTSFSLKEADKKLQEAREAQEKEIFKTALQGFQDILLKDIPAIFLVRPHYLYVVTPRLQGIEEHFIADPSKRFLGIENWYLKTRRVFR